MKRTLIMLLLLALVFSCFAAAMAENGNAPERKPRKENADMPDGEKSGEGERPEIPVFDGQAGTAPMHGSETDGMALPAEPGENGGMMGGRPGSGMDFETLVKKGIISEETMTAILEYIEANRPDDTEGRPDNAPEKPEGERPDDAPEKPEGGRPDVAPEIPEGEQTEPPVIFNTELLDKLREEGIITQSEYDTIIALQQSDNSEE